MPWTTADVRLTVADRRRARTDRSCHHTPASSKEQPDFWLDLLEKVDGQHHLFINLVHSLTSCECTKMLTVHCRPRTEPQALPKTARAPTAREMNVS